MKKDIEYWKLRANHYEIELSKAFDRIAYIENRETELWKAFGKFCEAINNRNKKENNEDTALGN